MSALAMIMGKLVGRPKAHETRNGGEVGFFRLRVANGSAVDYWDIATFDKAAIAELLGLPEGAPITATGSLAVEPWERNGKRGVNLKLTADLVLTLKSRKQRRAGAETASSSQTGSRDRAPPSDASNSRDLDDEIPF